MVYIWPKGVPGFNPEPGGGVGGLIQAERINIGPVINKIRCVNEFL